MNVRSKQPLLKPMDLVKWVAASVVFGLMMAVLGIPDFVAILSAFGFLVLALVAAALRNYNSRGSA